MDFAGETEVVQTLVSAGIEVVGPTRRRIVVGWDLCGLQLGGRGESVAVHREEQWIAVGLRDDEGGAVGAVVGVAVEQCLPGRQFLGTVVGSVRVLGCTGNGVAARVRLLRSDVATIVGYFGGVPLFAVGPVPVDVGALAIVPKGHLGRGRVVDPGHVSIPFGERGGTRHMGVTADTGVHGLAVGIESRVHHARKGSV